MMANRFFLITQRDGGWQFPSTRSNNLRLVRDCLVETGCFTKLKELHERRRAASEPTISTFKPANLLHVRSGGHMWILWWRATQRALSAQAAWWVVWGATVRSRCLPNWASASMRALKVDWT